MSTAPLAAAQVTSALTSDGGARQTDADLWCSYAAVRTMTWLGRGPDDPEGVARFLNSRQNADGGFGWQRGLPSDVWASYYCSQSLRDLGEPVAELDRLGDWVETLRTSDGGFAMTPGQSADVWATYYACRLYAEVLGRPLPDRSALAGWLGRLQVDGTGLAWSPGSPHRDVRACYYGALAWQAVCCGSSVPWDLTGLIGWVQDRQDADGGFAFVPGATACAWAGFRAAHALRSLGARPRDPDGAVRWLRSRELPSGGFERWPGYTRADVWACFCVVGALSALDRVVEAGTGDAITRFVQHCQLPGSGFTYRSPEDAGDSLATAAALLDGSVTDPAQSVALQSWLRSAQTPYEGGVMYMPGRGAEVRCTLWAASALRRTGSHLDAARLKPWLTGLQNVDGGVGYWIGRGSDLVSTASAVEVAVVADLDPAAILDSPAVLRFVARCRAGSGYASSPGGEPTLAATAQAARTLLALGETADGLALAQTISTWVSPLGGFSASPRAVPDLLSTYQAVLTLQQFGLACSDAAVARLLRRLQVEGGYAWSPLSHRAGGPLATALGRLLAAAVDADPTPLPRLSL